MNSTVHQPSLSGQIVLLLPGFARDMEDDTCIPILQDFIAGLREAHPELELNLLAFQYPNTASLYHWNGIKVNCLGGQNRGGIHRVNTWRKALVTLYRLHRMNPVHLIHSFWLSECALIGQLFSRWQRIPHLCSVMGQDALPQNPYLGWFKRVTPHLSCGSARAAQQIQALLPVQAAKIPMGIFPKHLPASHETERDIDILGVGSLAKVKNFSRFIDIIHSLIPHFPNLRVVIAGNGTLRGPLEEQIRLLQLQKNVMLVGHQSRSAVAELMMRSRILLHTAHYEGQCLVLWEALFWGVRVVSTPVGVAQDGPNMAVADKNEDLIAALKTFLPNNNFTQTNQPITTDDTTPAMSKLYLKLAPTLNQPKASDA